jgi:L-lactate dehydrogenase (cytochrome)
MNMLETVRSVMRFRGIERNRTSRTLAKAVNVEDLRAIARRRLPAGVFDYIDGGAEDERTLAANRDEYARIKFRPRVLSTTGIADPSTSLLGRRIPLPLVLAPTGFTRIADPDGECAVARAAARAGLPYTLSTLSTCSIEEVASVGGPRWFQLYVWRDRVLVQELLSRARDAGYETLVVTVDAAAWGRRERDVRRGFSLPPEIGLDTIVEGLAHPSWTYRFVRSEPIRFSNLVGSGVGDGASPVSLSEYITTELNLGLSWSDIEWLRSEWTGSFTLKGIQSVEDARIAAEHGVDAVIVSNHGGRQLDDGGATVSLIEPIADAVADRTQIICDGGVRRGSDVVKAVALGATACMFGRAYLYGLAAAGERGVDHVLQMLADDIRRTMSLIGTSSISDLTRRHVRLPEEI